MHIIQEGDVFAPSMGRYQLKYRNKRTVATPLGLCCTCFFAMISLLACGVLVAGVFGVDEYVNQSISMSQDTVGTETGSSIPVAQFVVSYDLSL